jgi:hypothetical protein
MAALGRFPLILILQVASVEEEWVTAQTVIEVVGDRAPQDLVAS